MKKIDTIYSINGEDLFISRLIVSEKKTTFIFLHDSLGCTTLWRNFPEKISEELQVNILVYDRLGYGKSAPMPSIDRPINYLELEADKLIGIIDYFELSDVWLFGHSDGGSIALIAAGKYPRYLNGVICEAGHIYVEDITISGIKTTLQAYKTTNLCDKLKKYHGEKVDTIFNAWTNTWTREEFKNWNVEHFMQSITCKLLFIQGNLDEFGSQNQVFDTVNAAKGIAEAVILEDVGHNPHKETPQLVLDKVKEFYFL